MAHYQRLERKSGVRWRAIVKRHGQTWTKTFDRQAASKAWATELEDKLRQGTATSGDRRTVAEAIDRYIRDVLPRKKPTTQRTTLPRLQWWRESFGTKRLEDLTPAFLVEVRDQLADGDRGPATVNRYLAAMSAVCSVAAGEWQWLGRQPFRAVDKLGEPKGRVRYLSADEIELLLAACRATRSPHLHAVVIVALATGMRKSEIVGLTWSRVDLRRRHLVLEETKGGRPRGIPLIDQAVEALRSIPRYINTDLVFPAPTDHSRPDDRALRWHWDAAVRSAGISDFRFHDLRHTSASYLIMSGVPIRDVAEILGHGAIQMTQRYSHLSQEHLRSALEHLSGAIFGAGPVDPGTPSDR